MSVCRTSMGPEYRTLLQELTLVFRTDAIKLSGFDVLLQARSEPRREGLRLTHDQLPVNRGQVERPINVGMIRVGVEELQVPVLGHGVNQRARVGLTEPGY